MLPAGLYLITDETMLRDSLERFGAFLDHALGSGLRVAQLRAKTLDPDTLEAAGALMRRLTRQHGAIFIVNDDLDLALRLDADGLHVGQSDRSPEECRQALGPDKLIGLSTHNRRQALEALDRPIDYIGLGPVFPTRTKQDADPAIGLDEMTRLRAKVSLPIVAIGGVSLHNLESVLQTGVTNVAVVSDIARAASPESATREYLARIERFQFDERDEGANHFSDSAYGRPPQPRVEARSGTKRQRKR